MIKVYCHPLSSASNKVLYCLNALDIVHEKIPVDLAAGEQGSPEHLKRNPFGKVPVIDDDGFVLFESDAIMRYLARKEKSALYPSTYQARALVDQWTDFSSFMLYLGMQKVFFHRVLAPMIGQEADEKIIAQGIAQVDAYLPVYEKHLAASEFLCGDTMTLADLALIAVLDSAEVSGLDLKPYTSLSKWRNGLKAQKFYTNVHNFYAQGILPNAR